MPSFDPGNSGNAAQSGATSGAGSAQEVKRTRRLTASLPKGIHIGQRTDGRPKPYFVRFGKDRRIESFSNESERNDRAEKLAELQQNEGRLALEFDPAAWKAYQALLARTGLTLEQIEARLNAAMPPRETKTIADAVTEYLALRLKEDIREDSDTHRHLKLHLGRFAGVFGPLELSQLTAPDIRGWLDGLRHPKTGHAMTNLTKRHHRKDVNTFLKRCVTEEWLDKNPCAAVIPAKVDDEDVEILSPREIFALLKANRNELVVGKLAFELFGGLRCSSAERLKPEHIKREAKGIEMPGQRHKSGKRKFRQGHPDTLWAWIEFVPPEAWTAVTERNYDHLKGDAFIRAGVKNTGNVLRHSFASYMLAKTKNMAAVGYLMQHKHTSTTEKYEGVATESDAKLVLAMTPASLLGSWEEFSAGLAPIAAP
jgi:site-specific recombinase XerD